MPKGVRLRTVIARQYVGVTIERGVCTSCGDPCIICFDDTSSCCSAPVKRFKSGVVVKEVSGKTYRKAPPKQLKLKILEDQDNKCFWCGREFGTFILSPKNIIRRLSPVWDHYIPYCYTGSNNRFVASCERCNFHKSAVIITDKDTELSLKEHLKKIWHKGGWKDMEEDGNA